MSVASVRRTAPREVAIRQALHTHLRATLGAEATLIDELGVKHGEYRVDVAALADRLYGYEIKSDVDTLKRLPEQAKQFSLVFQRMHLVVGTEHLGEALLIIPKWWGILLATLDDAGGCAIAELRPALENPRPNYRWVVRLLWRDELRDLLKAAGQARGLSKLKYWQVANRMLEVFTPEELTAQVCRQLAERTVWNRRPDADEDGDDPGAFSSPDQAPFL